MIVGIDISKLTLDAAYETVDGWQRKSHEQTETGYDELLRQVGDQVTWFVMEATGSYFLRIANYLAQKGYQVAVLNPKVIHHYGKMHLTRGKTDKQDARLIAGYGMDYESKLKAWALPEQELVDLQQLQSFMALLKNQRTMITNHQEALNQHPECNAQLLVELEGMLADMKRHMRQLDLEIKRLALLKWSACYQRLLTIKGIGKTTAVALLVATQGFTRFVEVKEFLSFIGMAPKPSESGTSVKHKPHISKMGNPHIRQLLYMCAWTAKRTNPACVALYQRLKAKGKPEKLIKVAVAHKLLRQAFAVTLSQTDFDASFA